MDSIYNIFDDKMHKSISSCDINLQHNRGKKIIFLNKGFSVENKIDEFKSGRIVMKENIHSYIFIIWMINKISFGTENRKEEIIEGRNSILKKRKKRNIPFRSQSWNLGNISQFNHKKNNMEKN
jgi:hypothetical protein